MPTDANSEITSLRSLSARLGRDPLLVQAATGNTSIKLDGLLWIKASGRWLAQAEQEEIFVPVQLAEARAGIARGLDPAGSSAGASVETAMHVVITHRVVVHVHSVNSVAWAVRRDVSALEGRLAGLRWRWIPYTSSGLDLAKEIGRTPEAEAFVLANHGLVVCGDDCQTPENLLREVERRLSIEPRPAPEPDWHRLAECTRRAGWRLPQDPAVHTLGTDSISRQILSGGVLYPCQAIFLAQGEFRVVEGAGVIVRNGAGAVVDATLSGLARVLRRVDSPTEVRYLSRDEVQRLLNADVYRYRKLVETGGASLEPGPGMMKVRSLA